MLHYAGFTGYRIHFTDNYGQATIECDDLESFQEALHNIQQDAQCNDIWCEYYDDEEGWQA